MVRRSPLIANACGLVVGCAVLVGCGGDVDLDSGIDDAVARAQALEDDVGQLELAITTSTTAVAPPATLATLPPTTRDPSAPPPTTPETQPPASAVADASQEDILFLVGTAAWDPSLPIPSSCVGSASFAPSGEGGINGGVITCTVDAPRSEVESYYRLALARAGFPFSTYGGESDFGFTIGSQADITGGSSGDRTTLTIEQRF